MNEKVFVKSSKPWHRVCILGPAPNCHRYNQAKQKSSVQTPSITFGTWSFTHSQQTLNIVYPHIKAAMASVTSRQAFRRTDDYTPGSAKVKLVTEDLPLPLHPTAVLIKVRAVSLNYRDANIANGGNPWPVIPNGIPGNDAAGEIIAVGDRVSLVSVGDRVAPITDSEYVSARSTGRSWLAANEDGTLATRLIFDEKLVTKLPTHLDWVQASIIPCAGTTAWSALKGAAMGQTVLIQGNSPGSSCCPLANNSC